MSVQKYLRPFALPLESRIRIRPRTLQSDFGANPLFDRGLGNMAHSRRNTQLLELPSKNLRDLRIVQTGRNSSINTDEAAGKINQILLVSINPTINLSQDSLRGLRISLGTGPHPLIVPSDPCRGTLNSWSLQSL